jgi:hypothetical protein
MRQNGVHVVMLKEQLCAMFIMCLFKRKSDDPIVPAATATVGEGVNDENE